MDWDSAAVLNFIRQALEEDVGRGDASSLATVPEGAMARVRILAKAPLGCAGLPAAERVFPVLDPAIEIELLAKDGDAVENPCDLMRLRGRARAILLGERVALNFLAHMSGIAALTRRFVEHLAGTKARIRDTRKTTPGLRTLEKYGVRMGGRTNHRFGMHDAIFLKENHITMAGDVKAALEKAPTYAAAQVPLREMSA